MHGQFQSARQHGRDANNIASEELCPGQGTLYVAIAFCISEHYDAVYVKILVVGKVFLLATGKRSVLRKCDSW